MKKKNKRDDFQRERNLPHKRIETNQQEVGQILHPLEYQSSVEPLDYQIGQICY
jgi:hypothetical protein